MYEIATPCVLKSTFLSSFNDERDLGIAMKTQEVTPVECFPVRGLRVKLEND